MTHRFLLALALFLTVFAVPATGLADDVDDAQRAELAKLRAEVANEIQLAIFDLLDELVYGWTQKPPFATDTPVVLAGMTVPVGLGTGLQGVLENHLSGLLIANPSTRVALSHCPSCTAVVVHSGPKGTVVSRGLDNPKTLETIGGPGGRVGLYIDVAAEGTWLVLRARLTRMTPALPVIWSRTLSAAVGTPALLRQKRDLKSAQDARDEYLNALKGQGSFTVPVRVAVRSYERGDSAAGVPIPLLWIQTGVEVALTQARAWTASAIVGYGYLPEAYDGLMVQSRMSRLISGKARSFTGPDLYLFLGGAVMTLDGPAVQIFDREVPVGGTADGEDPRATFAAFHLGLELRVGNRIGFSVFGENMPAYGGTDRLGNAIVTPILDFHALGAEVSFCF